MENNKQIKIKYEDSTKKKIFSHIRNKYLDTQPEEIVRQEFVCKLVNEYGYSLSQMAEEVKLTTSLRGNGRASADIVVWKSEEDKKKKKIAFLVVELKAPNLALKVEDCYQGYNYATWSRAKLFAISNSKQLQVYKTVEEELPLQLQPVNDIPHFKMIQDEKKLEESLSQTKEFTGDEFAKLLHKCHNIIRNNDKLSPEASFDEISKILFIKIMYERKPKQEAIFSSKQFNLQKDKYFKELNTQRDNRIEWIEREKQKLIKSGDFDSAESKDKEIADIKKEEYPSFMQKLFEDVKEEFLTDNIFDENEKIKLRERSFEQIVKELEIYNLTSTSADVKGIAFEKFLGRTFRGELGQFFTPRVIVDFIVDLLEPKENELICDPCAGSGGFLIKAYESVKNDIDKYYIKLKKEKEKEIFGEKLENIDNEKLQKEYDKFLDTINKEQEEKIKKLSYESIFGTDANPRMARVSKMNMIMHGDGHNGIHHNDGLLNVNGIFRNRFDMIITNPPFGTNLDKKYPTVEEDDKYTNEIMINEYIEKYGDIYTQEMKQVTDNINKPIRELFEVGKTSGATEVLFIERCLDLLKPGGRMGIVLPEGVLNSANLKNAREYFESRAKILLIVSLPQDIFISSGATVKTSLVFLKKFTDKEKKEYEDIEEKSQEEIKNKYAYELEEIKSPVNLCDTNIKDTQENIKELNKDKKNNKAIIDTQKEYLQELRKQRRELVKEEKQKEKIFNAKVEEETKVLIKQKFDYEIPISEIKKAGITTTGTKTDNELPELLKVFREYRQVNKLWESN